MATSARSSRQARERLLVLIAQQDPRILQRQVLKMRRRKVERPADVLEALAHRDGPWFSFCEQPNEVAKREIPRGRQAIIAMRAAGLHE